MATWKVYVEKGFERREIYRADFRTCEEAKAFAVIEAERFEAWWASLEDGNEAMYDGLLFEGCELLVVYHSAGGSAGERDERDGYSEMMTAPGVWVAL